MLHASGMQNKLYNNLAYCHIKLNDAKKRKKLFPGGDLPIFFRILWSELYFKIGLKRKYAAQFFIYSS